MSKLVTDKVFPSFSVKVGKEKQGDFSALKDTTLLVKEVTTIFGRYVVYDMDVPKEPEGRFHCRRKMGILEMFSEMNFPFLK